MFLWETQVPFCNFVGLSSLNQTLKNRKTKSIFETFGGICNNTTRRGGGTRGGSEPMTNKLVSMVAIPTRNHASPGSIGIPSQRSTAEEDGKQIFDFLHSLWYFGFFIVYSWLGTHDICYIKLTDAKHSFFSPTVKDNCLILNVTSRCGRWHVFDVRKHWYPKVWSCSDKGAI